MGWRCGGCCSEGSTLWALDQFVLPADGRQDLTLSQTTAVSQSVSVYLNGIEQERSIDWTRVGSDLTIFALMKALTGDVVEVRYAYTS